MVPPEKLRPRPLILPTGSPHAATIGPTASVVLSPTPPGMLVHDDGAGQDVVQIELLAGGSHGQRQVGRLAVGHAPEVDGHEPGRGLVVRDRAGRDAVDKEVDLGAAQLVAVTLLDNDVDWVHTSYCIQSTDYLNRLYGLRQSV